MTKDIIVKELLVDLEKFYLRFLKNDPLTRFRLAELNSFDIPKDISKIVGRHLNISDDIDFAHNKLKERKNENVTS